MGEPPEHDVTDLEALELAGRYRSKDLSPVEVAQAILQRIEEVNDVVNAFCFVDEERTRAQARESEGRFASGAARGPLDGVPVSIKDVLLTRGWPTLKGSRTVDPTGPWSEDAPSVARLREQGAVFIGKTTTPELGWKGVTDSPLAGVTRNPWDLSRTSGGSSGGSAAALALGIGPLSVGTDGGGSVRIPGAFCGVVGLKPTFGRVPVWPPSPFGNLSHVGPMAGTVADAALLLDVIAQPDPRDWTALSAQPSPFSPIADGGVAGLKIAVSATLGYVEVDAEIAAATERAAALLEDLGAEVHHLDPGFEDPEEVFRVLWFSRAAAAIRDLPPQARDLLDEGLNEVAEEGLRISGQALLAADARRAELGTLMSAFHTKFDLLVTPTLPIAAFEVGREVPEGWPHRRWTTWTPFTYPFNLTHQPAITIPSSLTADGLPIGLQFVGGARGSSRVASRSLH